MPSYPGGNTTFVPSYEASGKLQIEFSRNPESFPLNRYVGFKKVKKSVGLYLNITAEEAARVVAMPDYVWPDGQDAPSGHDGTEQFDFLPYITERYAYAYALGDKAVNQATWEILATHGRIKAQQSMTARTLRMVTKLTTAGNWSGNTDTATNLGGGSWVGSSVANQFILKTFNQIKENIHQSTIGAVPADALRCVVSPAVAHIIREAPEITDFIKQNTASLQVMMGRAFFERWGVPEKLYGVKMVVEDTMRITSRKRTTDPDRAYIMPGTVAVFTSVPEGLENSREPADGVPTFDTAVVFAYEDMTVESRRDPDNRRTLARVVDDTAEVITAPASGYYVTAVTG